MSEQTFSRHCRLLRSNDYKRVFAKPKRVSAQGMLLIGIQNRENQCARLGVIVAKKVLAKAVWRNRIKRMVRESFRRARSSMGSIDVVFIAKAPIDKIDRQKLRCTLDKLWTQISLRLAD